MPIGWHTADLDTVRVRFCGSTTEHAMRSKDGRSTAAILAAQMQACIRCLSARCAAQATLLNVLGQPEMLAQALAAAAQGAPPAAEGAVDAQAVQLQAADGLEAAHAAAAGAAKAALASAADDEAGGGGEPMAQQLMIELASYQMPGDLPAFPAVDDDAPPAQRVRLV